MISKSQGSGTSASSSLSDLLRNLLHDSFFQSIENRSTIDLKEYAASLIDYGIVFLENRFEGKDFDVAIYEPIMLNAIELGLCQDQQITVDNDPILGLLHQKLEGRDSGFGKLWERFCARYFYLQFRDGGLNKSEILLDLLDKNQKKLGNKESFLDQYSFCATSCIDSTKKDFLEFLEESDREQFIFFPPNAAGPDIFITLKKIPKQESKSENWANLPDFRSILIQCKYFTTGIPLSGEELDRAIETTFIENLYIGYKEADSVSLKLAKGQSLTSYSISILLIAGKAALDASSRACKLLKDTQTFKLIGPLEHKFPKIIQDFLIEQCQLLEDQRKKDAKQLFDQKNFKELDSQDMLDYLSKTELVEISKGLAIKCSKVCFFCFLLLLFTFIYFT